MLRVGEWGSNLLELSSYKNNKIREQLKYSKSALDTLKRASIVYLICINFKEGHVHPACIFNRSPGIRPQARLNAAPDSISCIPNLEISSTMFPLGSMRLLNSSPSSAVKETPFSRVEILASLRLSDTTNKRIFGTA